MLIGWCDMQNPALTRLRYVVAGEYPSSGDCSLKQYPELWFHDVGNYAA
jgi:hypothetical protein